MAVYVMNGCYGFGLQKVQPIKRDEETAENIENI